MSINVTKVREEIRLNDEEDSPVYTFSFDDNEIDRLWRDAQGLQKHAEKLRDLDLQDEAKMRVARNDLAKTIEKGIVIFLGKDAYAEIVAYVGDGLPAKDINYELYHVFMYLMGRLNDRVVSRMTSDANRYLRKDDEQGTDIL